MWAGRGYSSSVGKHQMHSPWCFRQQEPSELTAWLRLLEVPSSGTSADFLKGKHLQESVGRNIKSLMRGNLISGAWGWGWETDFSWGTTAIMARKCRSVGGRLLTRRDSLQQYGMGMEFHHRPWQKVKSVCNSWKTLLLLDYNFPWQSPAAALVWLAHGKCSLMGKAILSKHLRE